MKIPIGPSKLEGKGPERKRDGKAATVRASELWVEMAARDQGKRDKNQRGGEHKDDEM